MHHTGLSSALCSGRNSSSPRDFEFYKLPVVAAVSDVVIVAAVSDVAIVAQSPMVTTSTQYLLLHWVICDKVIRHIITILHVSICIAGELLLIQQ